MPAKSAKKTIRSQQGNNIGNQILKCLQSLEEAIPSQQGNNIGKIKLLNARKAFKKGNTFPARQEDRKFIL